MSQISAIIADDEKPLRDHLKARLTQLWPELWICAEAKNGLQALELIEEKRPDVVFLDIRMPGLSGIEVAGRMTTASSVVFITAFDRYAIEAFENGAIDYLLKPVTDARLQKTLTRLKKTLDPAGGLPKGFSEVMQKLLTEAEARKAKGYLKWIKVRQGENIRLIPVEEVCYFKAADKYTVVRTREGESLIKTSIRHLVDNLDPELFWRIHRSTIVNIVRTASVNRSFAGRMDVTLEDVSEKLTVSKTYAHLFRQM